jgi:hypothetical protein
MSCYLRNMKNVLQEAQIEISGKNKKQVDQVIHQLVGVDYKNCSSAWKKVKEQLAGDEQKRRTFIEHLQNVLK